MAGITESTDWRGHGLGSTLGALVGELGSGKEEGPEVQRCWKMLHVGGETGSDLQ